MQVKLKCLQGLVRALMTRKMAHEAEQLCVTQGLGGAFDSRGIWVWGSLSEEGLSELRQGGGGALHTGLGESSPADWCGGAGCGWYRRGGPNPSSPGH